MVEYSASNQNRRLVNKRIMRLSKTNPPQFDDVQPSPPFLPQVQGYKCCSVFIKVSAFYTLQIYQADPKKMYSRNEMFT